MSIKQMLLLSSCVTRVLNEDKFLINAETGYENNIC